MHKTTVSCSARWIGRMADVDQGAWDALALPLKTPLLEWEWLNQMEASGSIAPEKGWQPNHLTVWSGNRLVGAAPLYIKFHSEGEFVFDQIWADVAGRLGIRYYPKLVGMSPVTPVTGYRFLIADDQDEAALTRQMVSEIDRFCMTSHLSGCSFLFTDPAWEPCLTGTGFVRWLHQSFVWENEEFGTFQDYLHRFSANQRRNIRRERTALERQDLCVRAFAGDEIPPGFISQMYRFYEMTNDQHGPWGCKYLTPDFFEGIYDRYRHRLLFMAACPGESRKAPVGMSMLLHKGRQMLGRYWGCDRPVNYLHFNVCYYQPIEWAIGHDIRYFNPGAGGSHKVRRGFRSVATHSFHRFYDHQMALIMRTHIPEINRMEQEHIDTLNTELPFARR